MMPPLSLLAELLRDVSPFALYLRHAISYVIEDYADTLTPLILITLFMLVIAYCRHYGWHTPLMAAAEHYCRLTPYWLIIHRAAAFIYFRYITLMPFAVITTKPHYVIAIAITTNILFRLLSPSLKAPYVSPQASSLKAAIAADDALPCYHHIAELTSYHACRHYC